MVNIVYISVLLAALTQPAHSSRNNLEYELDVIGENNLDRIDKDSSDPGVTIFKPIDNAEIRVVKYGDNTIWRRTGKKHLLLLRVFKVGADDSFMNLFYLDGKKVFAAVFSKNGEKWKNTGKYQVKNPEEITGEPLSKLRSEFNKDSSDSSSESSLDFSDAEKEDNVDLDLGGYLEDFVKVKEYYFSKVFTTEYRPLGGKVVNSVIDGFKTIWKMEPGKKPLRQMFRYNKMGFVPLIHICTGDEPFDSGDQYYEKVKHDWMPVDMDKFLRRLKYAMSGDIDPQFDQPDEVFESQSAVGASAAGNNLAKMSTWSEYPFSKPLTLKSVDSMGSTNGGLNSGMERLKTSIQEVPISNKDSSYAAKGPYSGPSESEIGSSNPSIPFGSPSENLLGIPGRHPEENEIRSIGNKSDGDLIDLTSGYELLFGPDAPRSLTSNPEIKTTT